MNKKRELLVSGFALFSMFFGAGNLIFPPLLGLQTGAQWFPAMLGFLITGVGIVMMAVVATARSGGSIDDISSKVGRTFSLIFGTLIILSIGPGLAIPRTAAVTHEVIAGALFPELNPIITSVIFFLLVLYFSLNPGKIIERLGTILTPVLLVALAVIIFKAIFTPLGTPVSFDLTNVFGSSFEEGYQTMDALAALVFTSVVIAGFKFKGMTEEKELISHTIKSAIIAAIGLSLIYGGLLYMGATASGVFPADIERTDLLVKSAQALLGTTGSVAMSVAMALACLTTAIGLTATVGEFFENLSGHRLSYRTVVLISTVFSGIFAVTGVEYIVKVSVPVLVGLYPVAITLIFLNVSDKFGNRRSTQIGGVVGAFFPTLSMITSALFGLNLVEKLNGVLPAALSSFSWIVPTVLFAVIFTLLGIGDRDKANA